MNINDYLLKFRGYVDLLALFGHNLTTKDHVDAIFEGIPPEYETFVTSVNSRMEPYSVDEIESLLLAQEVKIEKNTTSLEANLAAKKKFGTPSSFSPTYSPHPSYGGGGHPGYGSRSSFGSSNGFPGHFSIRGHLGSSHGGFSSGRGSFSQGHGQAHGRGHWNTGGKVQCQLCGRVGQLCKILLQI